MKKQNSKIAKLKVCAYTLVALTVLMLASGIQLEVSWLGMCWVWLHIAVGILFFAFIAWHLELHYGWHNWYSRLKTQKSPVTKWLAVFGALTLLTAIAAIVQIFITWHHSPIGGWHGKIGFVMIILVIAHTAKRHKFLFHRK